jgi:hypothetical protein
MDSEFVKANKDKTQKWLIGYKKGKEWETVTIPGDISEHVVEIVLEDLNKKYDIVYSRIIMGTIENNRHRTPRGEFLGL